MKYRQTDRHCNTAVCSVWLACVLLAYCASSTPYPPSLHVHPCAVRVVCLPPADTPAPPIPYCAALIVLDLSLPPPLPPSWLQPHYYTILVHLIMTFAGTNLKGLDPRSRVDSASWNYRMMELSH